MIKDIKYKTNIGHKQINWRDDIKSVAVDALLLDKPALCIKSYPYVFVDSPRAVLINKFAGLDPPIALNARNSIR